MDQTEPTRGQRLRSIRKDLKWTQSQLGEYLGIGQTTVHRAERDDPTIPTIFWVAFTSFCDWVDKKGIRTQDLPDGPTKYLVGKAPPNETSQETSE